LHEGLAEQKGIALAYEFQAVHSQAGEGCQLSWLAARQVDICHLLHTYLPTTAGYFSADGFFRLRRLFH